MRGIGKAEAGWPPLCAAAMPRDSEDFLGFAPVHMAVPFLGLVRKINIAQIIRKCENRGINRNELTKGQRERVKAMLPPEKAGKRGRPRKDDRNMLNGLLWIVRSGAQWREMPEAYGPWQSV